MRELERRACESGDLNTYALMERAGAAALNALRAAWPEASRIAVVCGKGNNGGDGYVLARLARLAGLEVTVLQVAAPGGGDAALALGGLHKAGLALRPFAPDYLAGVDVIVDALLGIGISGAPAGPLAAAIAAINAAGKPVLALDLPSGLDGDTGQAAGPAVRATRTICFVAWKRGLFLGSGPALAGQRQLADLGLPDAVYAGFRPEVRVLRAEALPPRRRDAHKGDFGHVLCLGGAPGMSGAIRLAGEAALRCGAGLVSIATDVGHAALLNLDRPELMVRAIVGLDDPALAEALGRATALVLGPGLGRSAWSRFLAESALSSRKPLVVDADGLNLLASGLGGGARQDLILTPHPGEAARLLGMESAAIQADRSGAARAIARSYGAICVLKGAGTVVAHPDGSLAIATGGNPGMASGGMGDVLAGVIGALLAQGLLPWEAACQGVALHAEAGDRAAAEGGERGLLASDLLPWLRRLINAVD